MCLVDGLSSCSWWGRHGRSWGKRPSPEFALSFCFNVMCMYVCHRISKKHEKPRTKCVRLDEECCLLAAWSQHSARSDHGIKHLEGLRAVQAPRSAITLMQAREDIQVTLSAEMPVMMMSGCVLGAWYKSLSGPRWLKSSPVVRLTTSAPKFQQALGREQPKGRKCLFLFLRISLLLKIRGGSCEGGGQGQDAIHTT